jgi:hypothetical protein
VDATSVGRWSIPTTAIAINITLVACGEIYGNPKLPIVGASIRIEVVGVTCGAITTIEKAKRIDARFVFVFKCNGGTYVGCHDGFILYRFLRVLTPRDDLADYILAEPTRNGRKFIFAGTVSTPS